jgi:ligand-binding sensor domain-containing protein
MSNACSQQPAHPFGRVNLRALVLVAIGALFMIGLVVVFALLHTDWVLATLPPGWQIIRPPYEVCALALDGERVWAGGRDGLFCFNRKNGQRRALSADAPRMSYVSALLRDTKEHLWIAHLEGLTCLQRTSTEPVSVRWTTWAVGKDGLRARPLSLAEDAEGTLWVGTENGLQQLYEGRWSTVEVPKDLGLSVIDVLYRDRGGIWWLGCASPTQGGLFSYDGKKWRTYTRADGLQHLSVNAVHQLRDGTLWVATGFANQGAASRWMGDHFETWTKKDGLAGEKARSIFEDSAGRLWFGSEYDGVAVLEHSRWHILRPQTGLAGREAKAILQDQDGVYWLGTDQGLSRIESWAAVEKAESAP